MPRWVLIVLLLVIAQAAQAQRRTPYIPGSAGVVLQRVPVSTDPRVRAFNQLREAQRADPHNLSKAAALARAYVDYGRATGDARFLGRAEAVIAPFMDAPDPPIPLALIQATIEQSRHAFGQSRVELAQILKRDPNNVQALLTLATVAMVQGDHPAANEACVRLANAGGDFMGLVCSASLRGLSGQGRQAYALLNLVKDPGPKAPPEIQAWLQGLMADTAARLGNAQGADQHFRDALTWTPGDNFLLADYGEFLLDQGRYQDAINLIGSDTQSDTSFRIVVTAEAAMKSPKARADIDAMTARFASMDQRGDHVFLREEADFLLHVQHHSAPALARAKENWQHQRAPKDVRIYLEAALAANDPAAAQPVLDFIEKTGLRDVAIDPLVLQLTSTSTKASR